MAPSVTETVSQTADQVREKLASVSLSKVENGGEVKNEHEPAPAVQGPAPSIELKTGHKEPLKLSGALDHFESFDVTPIIGREFVGVNLAKWLRAPNSDELIRDLAITSTFPHPPYLSMDLN
jgi:hypothetical protein